MTINILIKLNYPNYYYYYYYYYFLHLKKKKKKKKKKKNKKKKKKKKKISPIRKDSEKWYASKSILEIKDINNYDYDHTEVYKNIPEYYKYLCFNCQIILDSIKPQNHQSLYLPHYVADRIIKYSS